MLVLKWYARHLGFKRGRYNEYFDINGFIIQS